MSSDDARDFRRRQAYNAQRGRRDNVRRPDYSKRAEYFRNGKVVEFPERYTAQEGSLERAKARTKNRARKMKLRIASLILAAGIGMGGISVVGSLHKDSEKTITQLQEMGVNINQIGLGADTLQTLKKYDEYFAEFDKNKDISVTDNNVIDMVEEIKVLNENVIEDKIANLRGVNREDVKLDYYFDNSDGTTHTTVTINEDGYGKEEKYFNVDDLLFEVGKKNSIPDEVASLIVQSNEYQGIIDDLKNDKITKVNAVKKIERLYRNISGVATKQFEIDEKGNITTDKFDSKNIQDDTKDDLGR